MTAITELAQILKAAANTTADAIDRLKAFPGDELIDLSQHEGEQVDIDIATLNQWYELSSPANIRTLVEALEKAQQQIIALQQRHEIDPRTHEIIDMKERIDNLESFRTAYMEWGDKTDWMQTGKRFDFLKPWGKHRADVLKEYIQHLESRTVKLPKKNIGWDRDEEDCWNNAIDACAEVLTAAGIKVEDE